jgi:hypothetical protein
MCGVLAVSLTRGQPCTALDVNSYGQPLEVCLRAPRWRGSGDSHKRRSQLLRDRQWRWSVTLAFSLFQTLLA